MRAWILDALKNGHYHRDAIYKHVSLQPGMLEEHEELKSTLRSTVVTSLGKEKNARVPLFEQDDEHYPYNPNPHPDPHPNPISLTLRAGRRA